MRLWKDTGDKMDYGKNTNKEKLVEDAIAKAKELIQNVMMKMEIV